MSNKFRNRVKVAGDLLPYKLSISNMWETAALVEVLEKKGLLTKQDLLDSIRELRRKNPQAKTPLEVDDQPDPASPNPICSRKQRMPSSIRSLTC